MSGDGHVHQRDDELSLCRAHVHRLTYLLGQWYSSLRGSQKDEHNYWNNPIRRESRSKASRRRTRDNKVGVEDCQLPLLDDNMSHDTAHGHVRIVRKRIRIRESVLCERSVYIVLHICGEYGQCLCLCHHGTTFERHCFKRVQLGNYLFAILKLILICE